MKLKALALSALLLLAFSTAALAHEFVIKPDKVKGGKGDGVTIDLMASHVFTESEEVENLADVEAFWRQNGQDMPMELKANEKALTLQGGFTLADNKPGYVLAHRKVQYWSQTPDGMVAGGPKDLAGKKVLYTNAYEKFSKLLINASVADQDFSKPVGQTLEVVPLDNPAKIKPGQEMKVQVLYGGEPVNVPIYATYLGFSQRENTYAYYTAPEEGDTYVKISAPGLWMVRANYVVPGKDGIKTRDFKAILEFEVK